MDISIQDRRWQGYKHPIVREHMLLFFREAPNLVHGLDAHFKPLSYCEAQTPIAVLDTLLEYAPRELIASFDPKERSEFVNGTPIPHCDLARHFVYEINQPFGFPPGELGFVNEKLLEAGSRLGEDHRAYGAHAITHARFVRVCAHLAANHPEGRVFLRDALEAQAHPVMAMTSRERFESLGLRVIRGG